MSYGNEKIQMPNDEQLKQYEEQQRNRFFEKFKEALSAYSDDNIGSIPYTLNRNYL